MEWKTMLAYITGAVDEEPLLRVDSPPGRNPGIYRLVERSLSALQKDRANSTARSGRGANDTG